MKTLRTIIVSYMRRPVLLFVGLTLLTATACSRGPVVNPDPNHTHADFAVWVGGEKLDFSGEEFVSGTWTDQEQHDEEGDYIRVAV